MLPYSVFVVDLDEQELAEVGTVRRTDFLPSFSPFLGRITICDDDRNSSPNHAEYMIARQNSAV